MISDSHNQICVKLKNHLANHIMSAQRASKHKCCNMKVNGYQNQGVELELLLDQLFHPPILLTDLLLELQLGILIEFSHLPLQGFALLDKALRHTMHFLLEDLNLDLREIF